MCRPNDGCFAGELIIVVQVRDRKRPVIRNQPLQLAKRQVLSIEAVRAYLGPLLPAYMLPSNCIVVESMPFVPSLKVDRKAVDAWLRCMQKRPSFVTAAVLAGFEDSALQAEEVIANGIGSEVVRMLSDRDGIERSELFGKDFNLQKAGVDSIQIMSLSLHVQRHYKMKLPLQVLLSSKLTVRNVAAVVEGKDANSVFKKVSVVNLLDEAGKLHKNLLRQLPSSNLEPSPGAHSPSHNILLTGASGYLGIIILKELLELSAVKVFATMRCANEAEGRDRLISKARESGWWRNTYTTRLVVWQADLEEPLLGLRDRCIDLPHGQSSDTDGLGIRTIIHNAAHVHYNLDYQTLKRANIDSTLELLRMTAASRTVANFVLVSGGRSPGDEGESPSLTASKLVSSTGYGQTKFVAEHVLRSIASSSENVLAQRNLYLVRPGFLIGEPSARSNQSMLQPPNPRDFLWRLVAGCIGAGGYHKDAASGWLYVASVQRAASATVALISGVDTPKQDNQRGGLTVDAVLDGLTFGDLWEVVKEHGYSLNPLTHAEWMRRLRKAVDVNEKHPLFPLMHILEQEHPEMVATRREDAVPDDREAREAVKDVVRSNISHLIKIEFLPRAPRRDPMVCEVAS